LPSHFSLSPLNVPETDADAIPAPPQDILRVLLCSGTSWKWRLVQRCISMPGKNLLQLRPQKVVPGLV
jgi:hypothetical protein